MNDECLRASFALLCLDRSGRPNPQELLPCERCGHATCGWCEACGPLWAGTVNPTPICSLCDDERLLCMECTREGYSWQMARCFYQMFYDEIYKFKVQGTWQAYVPESERHWLRMQFGGESEWMLNPKVLADFGAHRDPRRARLSRYRWRVLVCRLHVQRFRARVQLLAWQCRHGLNV